MSKAEIEKLIDYIRNHQNGIITRMERYHTQLENPGDIGHMYNIPGDYVALTIQVYDPIPDKFEFIREVKNE